MIGTKFNYNNSEGLISQAVLYLSTATSKENDQEAEINNIRREINNISNIKYQECISELQYLLDIEETLNSIKQLIIELLSNPLYAKKFAKIISLIFPVILRSFIDKELVVYILGVFMSKDSLWSNIINMRGNDILNMCKSSIENGNLFSGSLSYNYALISYIASICFHDKFMSDFKNIWLGFGSYLKGIVLPYIELFKMNKKTDVVCEQNLDLFTSLFEFIVDILQDESTDEFIEAIVQTLVVDIDNITTLLNINNFKYVLTGKDFIYSELPGIIPECIDEYIELICDYVMSSRRTESIGITFLKTILNVIEEDKYQKIADKKKKDKMKKQNKLFKPIDDVNIELNISVEATITRHVVVSKPTNAGSFGKRCFTSS
jgi:hypothetical protein